jgi:hypothetical protein
MSLLKVQDRLGAVGRAINVVTLVDEDLSQRAPNREVVFDQQNTALPTTRRGLPRAAICGFGDHLLVCTYDCEGRQATELEFPGG